MTPTKAVDTHAPVGSVVIERTVWMHQYNGGYSDIHDLAWEPVRAIEMTIENRGAATYLKRNHRVVWTDARGEERIFYGRDYRYVELRVWHDGSVTVEEKWER